MGGYGSGRCGYSTTTKLDDGLSLDINKLKRQGHVGLNKWRKGGLIWTIVGTDEETGSIGYEVNTLNPDDMWFRAHYTHTPYDSEPIKMDYKIKLVTIEPNYGGKRLWFICPLTGKRTTILYSPSGSRHFASRYAFRLKYSSQSKSAHDRAIDRMWKHRRKLGGGASPVRPKGMHHKTFYKMAGEFEQAEAAADSFLMMFLERFNSRRGV